jgi:hypothetical protein
LSWSKAIVQPLWRINFGSGLIHLALSHFIPSLSAPCPPGPFPCLSLSLKGRFLPKPPMDQLGRYNNVRTVYPATTTKYIYIYTYIYQHHQEPRSPSSLGWYWIRNIRNSLDPGETQAAPSLFLIKSIPSPLPPPPPPPRRLI